jgi:cytoskeletal protein CcmA (bactofilin family)
VFIFIIAQTLKLDTGVKIILTNGALASNIFWVVAESVVIQSKAVFQGTILCKTNIALITGAILNGRLLAQTAVTLQMNTVVIKKN